MSESVSSKSTASFKVISLDLTYVKCCRQLDEIALQGLWSYQQWHDELANPQSICIGIKKLSKLLAVGSGQVVVDELQLTSLAVHPQFRRKGIGRSLLLILFEEARSRGAVKAILEVSSKNIAARALYNGLGFKTTGSRKRYYSNGGEALIQSCSLDG